MGDFSGYKASLAGPGLPNVTPLPGVETSVDGTVLDDYRTPPVNGVPTPHNPDNIVTVWPQLVYETPPLALKSDEPNTHQAWTLPVGIAAKAEYSWPDSPDNDVVDNPKAKEPSHRMTQALQPVPGYETTTVRKGKPHTKPNEPVSRDLTQTFERLPNPLTKPEAKQALKDHVSHQCCYGKRAANDIEVEQIIHLPVHQYTLRTFTEKRETIRVYEPFQGQVIDGTSDGLQPPTIWQVNNNPDALWKKHSKTCKIPRTSTVETCHGCTGRGFNKCYRCQGRGTTLCKRCKGNGKVKEASCGSCDGSGHPSCKLCRGHACIVCSVCQGNKFLHFYINLISTFDIIEDETWLNQTKVQKKQLQKVHKIKIAEMNSVMVSPISNYLTNDVNKASTDLVSKHSTNTTQRIIQQTHVLFAIPAVEAKYKWKRKMKSFWVYGQENLVYAPYYPESCCGRCTIC